MIRKKEEALRTDIDLYVPKLLEYLKANYVRLKPEIRYSLPVVPGKTNSMREPEKQSDSGGEWFGEAASNEPAEQKTGGSEIRYSLPASEGEDIQTILSRAGRDMSVLESPAVKNYYHDWEKRNAVRKSFSSEVMRMVKERYTKASRFYGPAGLDRRIFNKIKTDYGYQPSKNTALRCCIGLRLNGNQAEELLKLAGYAFSPSDPSDLALRFCLDNGIWDIPSINYLLASFDVKDLEGVAPGEML